MYPTTRFNLQVINVVPATVSDAINIDLYNSSIYREIELSGVHTDTLIQGHTLRENVLTIEYNVSTDSGTKHFTRTVECIPGGITDITIEY